MTSAISNALSGIRAGAARLEAGASNVANLRSTGPLDPAAGEGRRAYLPVDVVQTGRPEGGVVATYRPREPAAVAEFAPDSPDADARGLVAAPNVDLATEAVGVAEAALVMRANIAVLRAADRMARGALDLLA